MAPKGYFLLIIICTNILLFACDRPECTNHNPVFEHNPPESAAYKTELARQLTQCNRSRLSFWFKEYRLTGEEEVLLFHVQGDGLCAVILFRVDRWEKLQELRLKRGVSFRGAEFREVVFTITNDSVNTTFLLQDFARIVD